MTCKKHPKYKAIRMPKADCEDCRKMWQERLAPAVQKLCDQYRKAMQ